MHENKRALRRAIMYPQDRLSLGFEYGILYAFLALGLWNTQ
jgi:hypothetical protein